VSTRWPGSSRRGAPCSGSSPGRATRAPGRSPGTCPAWTRCGSTPCGTPAGSTGSTACSWARSPARRRGGGLPPGGRDPRDRPRPIRGEARVQQGLLEGVPGPQRHPHRRGRGVPRRGRPALASRRPAGAAAGGEEERPRGRQGRPGVRRARRTGSVRRGRRARRRSPRGRMPRGLGGVGVRPERRRRPPRAAALHRLQAGARRGPGSEHRRHGLDLPRPPGRHGVHGAGRDGHRRPGVRGAFPGGPRLPRGALLRPHGDRIGAEGARVQRAVRRPETQVLLPMVDADFGEIAGAMAGRGLARLARSRAGRPWAGRARRSGGDRVPRLPRTFREGRAGRTGGADRGVAGVPRIHRSRRLRPGGDGRRPMLHRGGARRRPRRGGPALLRCRARGPVRRVLEPLGHRRAVHGARRAGPDSPSHGGRP